MVLLDAPEFGEAGGVDDFENAAFVVLPRDVAGVALVGVVEELLEEIPE